MNVIQRFPHRESLLSFGLTVTTLALCSAPAVAAAPNIVLMYIDNLGYGDLGCYGNIGIKTPRIDQLAAEGARCTDFYVVSSTCTVSRGALLTGRHPLRNGLVKQLGPEENWHGVGLPHRERILPQYLQEAGYATACFGKWNIGFAPGSRPTERGFDEFLGLRSGNINYFTHTYHGEYDIFKGTQRHRVEGYSTDIFAAAACDYIRHQTGGRKPFFVYLPFNAPHYVSAINMAKGEKPEWQVPGKYLERYGWAADDAHEKHRYFAVLTALDDAVGRVLDTLDEQGLRENTLVMFISDMGAILRPTHGFNAASNFPFRDGAPSMYEGGIRVPAMFRWPSKIGQGVECAEVLSHLDVLPLCLHAAGIARPKDRVLDGHDPLPALNGEAESPYRNLVSHLGGAAALREGRWKIVRQSALVPWELYDLIANPAESNNLAARRPDELKRLVALYTAWEGDMKNDASEPVSYEPAARPRGKANP
jgi:arylsulfatase A-like enzyme